MNNVEYKNTLYEVNEVFKSLDKNLLEKLPEELIKRIASEKSEKHTFAIDFDKPLKEQNFLKTTREFLAGLYLTYWADPIEKNNMKKRMIENERKQLEEYEKNYGSNVLNDNSEKENTAQEAISEPVQDAFVMLEVEEDGFWSRLWFKFKNLFKKK